MDKYEYKLKTEQMLELMDNGAYNRAAEIADAIDWKRVRNATMLTNVSDIYEKSGDYQKSYEALNIAYQRADGSRKVLYRLCALALKTGNVDEAIDYYDDFIQVAPKDPNQHILKYKILRARRTPIDQQIEALEEFKKAEYIEEWAFELAKLYQEAGMTAECLEECDDLILWFSEGKYVYKAMELKMQYKPLTPSQQDKYEHRFERIESETEEIPDLTEYLAKKEMLSNDGFDSEEEDELDNTVSEEEVLKASEEEVLQESEEIEELDVPVDEPGAEEPVTEEPADTNVTVQRLKQRGIASTMKLQDALKSLLRPEKPAADIQQEEEDMEEDAPELEAAIEEIESVADLDLVNQYTGRSQREKIVVDKDLEELKAEPLDETIEMYPIADALEAVAQTGDEASVEEASYVHGDVEEYGDEEPSVEEYTDDDSELISLDDVEELLVDFIENYEEDFEDKIEDDDEQDFEPVNTLEDIASEDYTEAEVGELFESEDDDIEEELLPSEAEEIEEELFESEADEVEELLPTEGEEIEEEPFESEDDDIEEELIPSEAKEIEEEPFESEADEVEELLPTEAEGIEEEPFESEADDIEEELLPSEAEEIEEEPFESEADEVEELLPTEAEEIEEELLESEADDVVEEQFETEADEIEEGLLETEADEIEEELLESQAVETEKGLLKSGASKVEEELFETDGDDVEEEQLETDSDDVKEELLGSEADKVEEGQFASEADKVEEQLASEAEQAEEAVIPDNKAGKQKVYQDERIEETKTAKNIKSEIKKSADNQIEGQLSIEDILMGLRDESAKEVEMEKKRKKAEPILPPDIQRLIDEIEGVLPEEPEPTRPSEAAEDNPRQNMGEITKQLNIDAIEEFLAAQDDEIDDYADELSYDNGGNGNSSETYSTDEYADGYEQEFDEEEHVGDVGYTSGEYTGQQEIEYEDGEYTDEDGYTSEEYVGQDEYEEEEHVDEDGYTSEEYADQDEYEEEERVDEDGYMSKEYVGQDEYEEEEYVDEDGYTSEEYVGQDEYEDEEYTDEDVYTSEEYADESENEEYADECEDTDEYEDDLAEDGYEEEAYSGEYEESDIAAGFEEEFRPNPEHTNGLDDREIPDNEEGHIDILSATTPMSRKETAKLIATGKTAPLPLDEISDALSMSDTGFVVHGRYDLAAQSGIGTRAGLTDEQKKLFSYFVPVRGMSEQLVDVLENDRNCTNREGTSRTGNLLIIGNKGNGKTVLAVDVVKAIQKQRNIRQGKVAIVTGESLNKKKIGDIFDKLYGGALIIEKAGKMSEKTVARLNKSMERDTGEMLIVLEEQRKPLDRLLSSNREFRRKFTCRLEVPIFINDELVTFGQTYAQENGYRIDEMGILALYSRIDNLQREDHAVTIAEVKEVMDEAMEHSQKASAKKLVKRVFGKNTDDADRIILSEKDFNI